jgi:hypothetical protein
MLDTLLSVVGGIISYLFGSFASLKLFQPGLEQAFGVWKILFAFIAAVSVFLSQTTKGLIGIFTLGILAAFMLGMNYGSKAAFPSFMYFWSPTDVSWFSFQLAQSCIVGVIIRLLSKLKDVLPTGKS